jgi:hypothetical protein
MDSAGRLHFRRTDVWSLTRGARDRQTLLPGRRLEGTGSLSGHLTTTGYFSTNICLGTPARMYELVVDTGSSITSVPCRQCAECGPHRCGSTGRFDELASNTAERAPCHSARHLLRCAACKRNNCMYRVGYLEGSSIEGRVLSDTVAFSAAATSPLTSVRTFFGCQLRETGKFRQQIADGILGLQADDHHASPRTSRMPSVLHALVEQQGAANAFSLCLSSRAGLLLLGGRAREDALMRIGATIAHMQRGSPERFTLTLLDVLVEAAPSMGSRNGTARVSTLGATSAPSRRRSTGHRATPSFVSLGAPTRALNPTLVDSGTTFFFAATPLWRAIHAQLKQHAPELRRMGPHHVCAHMTSARRDRLPRLQLRLAGLNGKVASPLYIGPRQYMVRYPSPRQGTRHTWRAGERHYCAEIFNNGRSGGTVLGASVLRDREVIFDMARSTISFVDTDCDATTQRTAHMRDAFAFSPTCASAEDTRRNGTMNGTALLSVEKQRPFERNSSSSWAGSLLTSMLGVLGARGPPSLSLPGSSLVSKDSGQQR